jgi:hypothetical protein
MDQIILVIMAVVALWWGLRATAWKAMPARVRVARGSSLPRLRKRL